MPISLIPQVQNRSLSGSTNVTLADIKAYVDNIDPAAFHYWCLQDEAPTAPEVQAFFDDIGFRLPEEYGEFATSRLGGLHVVVREEVWPRRQGGVHWWFLYGISAFGIGRGLPEWLDLQSQYQSFQAGGSSNLLPFMRIVSDADRYCFTRDSTIVHWCHETNNTENVGGTFSDCLMRELSALEQRKDRVAQGGRTGFVDVPVDKLGQHNAVYGGKKREFPDRGPPCPKCHKLLRTPNARQCFRCGAEWH